MWGAIASAVGSTALGLYNTNKAQKENRYMSDTQFQRQAKDLKAAGINPIYAATKGGGAAAPPSPMAQSPDISKAFDNYSASQLKRTQQDVAKSQLDINTAMVQKTQAETEVATQKAIGLKEDNYKKAVTKYPYQQANKLLKHVDNKKAAYKRGVKKLWNKKTMEKRALANKNRTNQFLRALANKNRTAQFLKSRKLRR